jgi:hypothetical protein
MSLEHLVEWELARGNRSIWRKTCLSATVPQIRHHMNWDGTHAARGGKTGDKLSELWDGLLIVNYLEALSYLYMPGSLISVKSIVYTHVNLIVRYILFK